ncbi:tyrosine-type recombinase/integrase [Brucella pituitosa]|uniref:tyrosine-type recombinase/integrase n=1 Tax=Brucella pituitosa TaxID=571256 RepID=UPI000C277FD8|nr:site-specific integrase [Brucella pituitosa]PJO47187.1 integrase [Brucella pituitosa]
MRKSVLTSKAVETTKPDQKKRLEIPDAGLPGLYLVVQPSGAKSWAYRYRIDGKPKKLTIGSVLLKREAGDVDGDLPFGIPMTLSEARRATRQAIQLVSEGIDPVGAKKAAKENQKAEIDQEKNTVAYQAREFIKRYAKPNNRSWAEKERQFTAEINPVWGNRNVYSITKRDTIELLDTIIDRGSPVTANRVLATLKTFFGWLVERDVISSSPLTGLSKPTVEKSRDRVLSDEELRRIWIAAGDFEYPFCGFWRLLMLTGQRRNEVAGMMRSELTLDTPNPEWTIPAARTKNGKMHVVALAPSAKSIINECPQIGDKGFVFTTTGETPISGFSRSKNRFDAAILKLAKKETIIAGSDPDAIMIEPWTLHDLRRSMASGMARIGIALPVIERCLNHMSGSFAGIVGVYQRHEYRDETRAAFHAWDTFLNGLITPHMENNVVQINDKANRKSG